MRFFLCWWAALSALSLLGLADGADDKSPVKELLARKAQAILERKAAAKAKVAAAAAAAPPEPPKPAEAAAPEAVVLDAPAEPEAAPEPAKPDTAPEPVEEPAIDPPPEEAEPPVEEPAPTEAAAPEPVVLEAAPAEEPVVLDAAEEVVATPPEPEEAAPAPPEPEAAPEAARNETTPAPAPEPVVVTIKDYGSLRVDPGVEPADVVEAFGDAARARGYTAGIAELGVILAKLCEVLPCKRTFHTERVTADVPGVGSLRVEPWTEPADAVASLGRAAAAAGRPLGEGTAQAVLDAVCGARPCFRGLEKRLELNVTDIGQLVVEPYTEPADAVEAWTAAATMAGHAITEGGMRQMLQWACVRRRCVRDLIGTLRVNTSSALGVVECAPIEEPATAVERAAALAVSRGNAIPQQLVDDVMRWLCTRRSCHRPAATMNLTLKGVGTLVVPPWSEPAAVVERFAREAEDRGYAVSGDLVTDMLAWYCARRSCARGLQPRVTAEVEDFGTLSLSPWAEPAAAVEDFGLKAAQDGKIVPAQTLTALMEALCKSRVCNRLRLAAPWLANATQTSEPAEPAVEAPAAPVAEEPVKLS